MAQQVLFSEAGIELSITQELGNKVATLTITTANGPVSKSIQGDSLISFYRATRHLIQRVLLSESKSSSNSKQPSSRLELYKEVISRLISQPSQSAEIEVQRKEIFNDINSFIINIFGESSSEREEAAVFIGLPQEEIDLFTIERIQNATGDFMEALGFELETQEEPVFGSFYQRLKYLLKGEVKQEVGELYSKGKTALEVQFVSVPSAEATGKLATAAASLITALSGIDEASIRLGAILVVKVSRDGVPLILAETVSPELALLLDKNPQLLKNPNVVFDLISTMQAPAKTIEESGSAEVLE